MRANGHPPLNQVRRIHVRVRTTDLNRRFTRILQISESNKSAIHVKTPIHPKNHWHHTTTYSTTRQGVDTFSAGHPANLYDGAQPKTHEDANNRQHPNMYHTPTNASSHGNTISKPPNKKTQHNGHAHSKHN